VSLLSALIPATTPVQQICMLEQAHEGSMSKPRNGAGGGGATEIAVADMRSDVYFDGWT